MNLQQIKDAVSRGIPVWCVTLGAEVVFDKDKNLFVRTALSDYSLVEKMSKLCFTDCYHNEGEECTICVNCGECREDLDDSNHCMDCGGVNENEPSAIEIAEKLSLFDDMLAALEEIEAALIFLGGAYDNVGILPHIQNLAAKTVVSAKEISK